MRLLIKNMVSHRCKMVVRSELEKMDIKHSFIELGEVEVEGQLPLEMQKQLKNSLLAFGLVLMDDKKGILIEKIKNIIVEMVHYNEEIPAINFRTSLARN